MKRAILVFIFLFIPTLSYAYSDLDVNHSAYKDIIELESKNIVSGYPDNTFCPDNYITSEELITILINTMNDQIGENLSNWPEDYINIAKENEFDIASYFITRQDLLNIIHKVKEIKSIKYGNIEFVNELTMLNNFLNDRELIDLESNVTRADACKFINKLLYMNKTQLPLELDVVNDSDMSIKTIINLAEVVEFDSYTGKYKDVVNKIKNGEHPYLKFRKNRAEDNYLLIIDFETINDSKYEVFSSHESLKLNFTNETISVLDSFDIDEVNTQILDRPYSGTFIKSNNKYNTIAFYILNKMPRSVEINRDINTLYSQHTNEYINVNQLCSAIINL